MCGFFFFKQKTAYEVRISDWSSDVGSSVLRYAFALTVPLPVKQQVSRPEGKSEAPTGLIELSYKPVDDVMAYAKYSRGYRQGSVNLASDIGTDTFDPEHVNAYEIGAKTSFGGPVPGRFNVAAFYNDQIGRASCWERVCQYV